MIYEPFLYLHGCLKIENYFKLQIDVEKFSDFEEMVIKKSLSLILDIIKIWGFVIEM